MRNRLSKLFLSMTAALATMGAAANAADAVIAPDTQSIVPEFSSVQASSIWNGAYAGLYGGLNWQSVGEMGDGDIDLNKQKELGGYIGINQALGSSIVGGLEWMGGFNGSRESENGITAEQGWETSLRARMGYAFEQNLVYGLAGVNATQLELSDGAGSDQNWLTGFSVGAGVERQLTDRITGRIEYDYQNYGAKEFDLGTSSPEADLTGHGLKLGVGVKF